MKLETYELPEFWACALINNDESGMEDEDIDAMNAWLAANNPGYCLSCSDESSFMMYHDAYNYVLACDCLTFTFDSGE